MKFLRGCAKCKSIIIIHNNNNHVCLEFNESFKLTHPVFWSKRSICSNRLCDCDSMVYSNSNSHVIVCCCTLWSTMDKMGKWNRNTQYIFCVRVSWHQFQLIRTNILRWRDSLHLHHGNPGILYSIANKLFILHSGKIGRMPKQILYSQAYNCERALLTAQRSDRNLQLKI